MGTDSVRRNPSQAAIDQGHGNEPNGIEPITYVIKQTEHAQAITITVKCCLCNMPLEKRGHGWCYNCDTWPINITTIRYHGDHRVDVDGLCWKCQGYVLTKLDAQPGEWVDTGRVQTLMSKEENIRRLKILGKIVSGEMSKADTIRWCLEMERDEPGIGWRKAAFDLEAHIKGINASYAPRWLKRDGVVVGKTPLGDDILALPSGEISREETHAITDDVPF